jgi:hypothetical protein
MFACGFSTADGTQKLLRFADACPADCCFVFGPAGGLFVVVNVFLRDGETREQYMERYHANMAEAVDQGAVLLGCVAEPWDASALGCL